MDLAHLKAAIALVVLHRTIPFAVTALDGRRVGGGLRAGSLHEVAARSCSMMDDAAASLFLAGLAAREARNVSGPVL